MLIAKKLSKKFGTKTLFEDGELIIHKGEKVALVGQNGTGKSVLIKCISGEEDFEGTININKDIKISIMEQEKEFEKINQTFSEYLEEKQNSIDKIKQKYEEKLQDPSLYEDFQSLDKLLKSYESISRRIIEKVEITKIKSILNQLNFEMDSYNQEIVNLSGGQRTKLRLAECLSKEADMIILDEPTNHLDLKALEWLQEKLIKLNKTVLIVSHDRYLLKNLVNKVIEIENRKFQVYKSDYEEFLIEKEKHVESLEHKFYSVNKEKKRLTDSIKKKREWMLKSGNKLKAKKAMITRLERSIEDLPEVVNPNEFIKRFNLDFGISNRSGNLVFVLDDLKKSFNNVTLFNNLSLNINKGDKIAIIGENGSGKSTLLKILNGLMNFDEGVLTKGSNLNVGYFDQEFKNMDLNQKLINFFWSNFPNLNENTLISQAIKSGFSRDKLKNKIKTLSGGEKARLNFIRLMLEKHNVLLLDEPTNNLDVELVEVLEKSLRNYKGTIVFVSHDRYFIDKVSSKILIIKDKGIIEHEGNYSDLLI